MFVADQRADEQVRIEAPGATQVLAGRVEVVGEPERLLVADAVDTALGGAPVVISLGRACRSPRAPRARARVALLGSAPGSEHRERNQCGQQDRKAQVSPHVPLLPPSL